jgi:hypothetical protein
MQSLQDCNNFHKFWLDDTKAEIKRLEDNGILTPQIQNKVALITQVLISPEELHSYKERLSREGKLSSTFEKTCAFVIKYAMKRFNKTNLGENFLISDLSPNYLPKFVVMGMALELKRAFESTHYVYTHGHNIKWIICQDLIQYLESSACKPKSYQYFRLPLKEPYKENVHSFFARNQEAFKASQPDVQLGSEVLCLSGDIFDDENSESALDAFWKNLSVSRDDLLKSVFRSILTHYHPTMSKNKLEEAVQDLMNLSEAIHNESKEGVLNVVCILKKIIDDDETNIIYPSLPGGRPTEDFIRATQYRIIASQMTPERMDIFRLSTISEERLEHYKTEIEDIIRKLIG